MIIFSQEGDCIKPIIAELGNNPLPFPCPQSQASWLRALFLDPSPCDPWRKAKVASVSRVKLNCLLRVWEKFRGEKFRKEKKPGVPISHFNFLFLWSTK